MTPPQPRGHVRGRENLTCPPSASPAPMMPAGARSEGVAALRLAASPLAGMPGARPCRGCGRGIWCSPGWRGPAPRDLCGACFWATAP